MEISSSITKSIIKSDEILALQKIIAPQYSNNFISGSPLLLARSQSIRRYTELDNAKREYLRLCIRDENIAKILNHYGLTTFDLSDICELLNTNGSCHWTNGHHPALSTIAYAEPLIYVIESKNRGVPWKEISNNINEYWKEVIPQGGLLHKIK